VTTTWSYTPRNTNTDTHTIYIYTIYNTISILITLCIHSIPSHPHQALLYLLYPYQHPNSPTLQTPTLLVPVSRISCILPNAIFQIVLWHIARDTNTETEHWIANGKANGNASWRLLW